MCGGESLKFDVPPGFAGAFGLFSNANIQQPPEVIKAEPDTEQLLAGKFYESENGESDSSSEELDEKEEEEDAFFHEEDDDYEPLRAKPKKRRKRKGSYTYDVSCLSMLRIKQYKLRDRDKLI